MVVQELVTLLGFEIDDKKLDDLGKKMEGARNLALGLGAAVIGAGVAIFGITRSAANGAGEIVRLSAATGVATDDLQRMGYAAKMSNSSMEELASGYKVLGKNILEASKNPMGENAKMFRQLGVRIFDVNGKIRNANDVFLDVSGSLSKMTNATEKAAISQQILGRAGGGLMDFLNKGPQKIRELTEEFDAMGGALSKEQLETLSNFNDSFDRTFGLLGKIKNMIALQIAPVLTDMLDSFRKWFVQNQKLIKMGIEKTFGAIAMTLKLVFRLFEMGYKITKAFFGTFMSGETFVKLVLFALGAVAAVIGGVLVASVILLTKLLWGLFVAWVAAFAPVVGMVLLVGAALALVFLWLEDIYTFFQGGNSLTGALVEWIGGGLSKAMSFVKEKLAQFGAWLHEKMLAIFNGIGNAIVNVVMFFMNPLIKGIEWVFTKLGMMKARAPGFNTNGMSTAGGSAPSLSGISSSNVNNGGSFVFAPNITVESKNGDPVGTGEAVQKAIENPLDRMLRQTQRFVSPIG